MTTYDLQFRKLDSCDINIRDRATRLRRTERACVSYLKAYGNVQVDAFGKQGVVAAICRRQIPEPLHDAESAEPIVSNTSSQFPDGFHGLV